jgi:acetyl-CoA acetyltransferase
LSYIIGSGLTRFGNHAGLNTLDLMSTVAQQALDDAGLTRADIDGVICGYSSTFPHLMLATLFAEHFGITPSYAHAVQSGGATGLTLVMLAHHLCHSKASKRILVVAGENRLTGQSRDNSIQILAQVGHPDYEVPLGPIIPAYYGLVANRYMHDYGVTQENFAELAVLMRSHASLHPGAQFQEKITVEDVMQSKMISTPLKLLDCCHLADGASACVVSLEAIGCHPIRIAGAAQHHNAQHVSAMSNITRFGSDRCTQDALNMANRHLKEIEYAAIYDSFTVTLTILLEEIGIAPRGQAGHMAKDGYFNQDGPLPLNLHGGLLSYGHCGVAGSMAHLVETLLQMTGRAAHRQTPKAGLALLHGDGGVLSSHVSLVLEKA